MWLILLSDSRWGTLMVDAFNLSKVEHISFYRPLYERGEATWTIQIIGPSEDTEISVSAIRDLMLVDEGAFPARLVATLRHLMGGGAKEELVLFHEDEAVPFPEDLSGSPE